MRSVELFVGAGGLAMGLSEAGFAHDLVLDWDKYACDTIRENQRLGLKPLVDWPLEEKDIGQFDYSEMESPDLVSGGPPCQPFSLGGKHVGREDRRNMFPEVVRAIRELRPRAFLFENVPGLMRGSFTQYLEYLLLELSFPTVVRHNGEAWRTHSRRLDDYSRNGSHVDLRYDVKHRILRAADFGVPQRRQRVFIVGFRSDLSVDWEFPSRTHSEDALLYEKWVTGTYWERHHLDRPERPPGSMRIESLRRSRRMPEKLPWLTVRDAIRDLPDPRVAPSAFANHVYNPGARSYLGHTGSRLDEPAKTLKAGDHGVPGGENMLAFDDGSVRYLTVRESARLQTFPDEYVFYGSLTEKMRQLGNAVPVKLAAAVGKSVKLALGCQSEEPRDAQVPLAL